MPRLVEKPSVLEAAGTKPKLIREAVGRVNTATTDLSIAHMSSPEGWLEPGQTVICSAGEWVRYSSPHPGGAEYIAVCRPAFSPDTVRRDA